MDGILAVYKHFSKVPPEKLPEMLWEMLPGFLMGVGLAFVVLFLREWGVGLLAKRVERTSGRSYGVALWLKRVLESLQGWFVWLVGLYVAVQVMPYMTALDGASRRLFMFGVFVQLGLMAVHALSEWKQEYTRELRVKEPSRVAMMASMVRVGYVLVWLIVFILLLNNYGVNVSALVAGLGVGGVAIAFALQSILKDIFSSFSIVFDKPFVVGDFIVSGEYSGTVEEVGIKTTRIRSISGEQIVMSNSDLLEARIRNYRTLGERRVALTFRVDFETPAEKLAKIPGIVTDILAKNDDVRVDRVHLQSLTDFGPLFEVVFFVTVPDYTRMMDIQQDMYLNMFDIFAKEHIAFAVPVQKNMGEIVPHHQLGLNVATALKGRKTARK